MIESIILLLQVLLWPLCLGIVGLILLQGGAGDLSSAFGGGGALDSTLGVGASKKMAKVTGWMAGLFFAFVLFLAIPNKGGLGSPSKPDTKNTATTSVNAAASAPAPGTAPTAVKPAQPVAATSAPVLTPAVPASTPVIALPNDAVKQDAHNVVEKVEAKVEAVVAPVMAPAAPAVPVEIKPADAAPAVKPAQ